MGQNFSTLKPPNDRIILGYPFLWYFNLDIDWRTAQLKGQVTIETLKQMAI